MIGFLLCSGAKRFENKNFRTARLLSHRVFKTLRSNGAFFAHLIPCKINPRGAKNKRIASHHTQARWGHAGEDTLATVGTNSCHFQIP